MEVYELQVQLASLGHDPGKPDGLVGGRTMAAVEALLNKHGVPGRQSWGGPRRLVAAEQQVYVLLGIEAGTVDGLAGPQTWHARELWNWRKTQRGPNPQTWRDTDSSPILRDQKKQNWPREQDMELFYGKIGENQTIVTLPWPMRVAWDRDTQVRRVSCHEKTADSVLRVLGRVANSYDEMARTMGGLDLFGGCLNVRRMRGGTRWSMHAWGAAWDFDPERNQLRWGRQLAHLARPEFETFWRIWEEEGWVSLGRARDYDWMHVQAARL